MSSHGAPQPQNCVNLIGLSLCSRTPEGHALQMDVALLMQVQKA